MIALWSSFVLLIILLLALGLGVFNGKTHVINIKDCCNILYK